MVDNHCRSAHLCCQDSIARNSPVFPPPHPISGRHTRRHIATCTVCGRHFMISTHCRSVKFLTSGLALKTCYHIPNFELWCLVLSVELVWYIQRRKLQPVLSVNDSDISILLHKQQYQSSDFSFPCTWQLWSLFKRSTQGCLYGFRKATLLTVDPVMATSWSSSVTMVNWKHHKLKLHSEHHPAIQIGF